VADVTVTPKTPTRAAPANFTDDLTAATSGNTYLVPNDGNTRLVARSTPGATLTVETPGDVDGLAIADRAFTLAAGKVYVIPPLSPAAYGNTLRVTVSANTDLLAVKG